MRDGKVSFTPPKGFVMPEGAEPGQEIDLVCSFRLENGRLCLTKLGDTPMPGCGDDRGDRPDYQSMASGMREAMSADSTTGAS